MREIKFRAWHKTEKILGVVDVLTRLGAFLVGSAPTEVSIQGDFVVQLDNNNGHFCKLDEIELMQFTGLLDKNGKEIYEGDVIKFTSDVLKIKKIFFIEFQEGRFIPIPFTKYISEIANNGEVIGNIYENPELLTKEE